VLKVLHHHVNFGGARISSAAGAAKNVEFFCLSVTLLKVRNCAPDFDVKALGYRNYFDTFAQGKLCSSAPVFNFLRLPPTGDTIKTSNSNKKASIH